MKNLRIMLMVNHLENKLIIKDAYNEEIYFSNCIGKKDRARQLKEEKKRCLKDYKANYKILKKTLKKEGR